MVACEVAVLIEVFGGDFWPEGFDFILNFVGHFEVVEADASAFVEFGFMAVVKLLGKHAVHLFDAAFMGAVCLHNFEEEGIVEGDDWDG